jgi:hypothetical protein
MVPQNGSSGTIEGLKYFHDAAHVGTAVLLEPAIQDCRLGLRLWTDETTLKSDTAESEANFTSAFTDDSMSERKYVTC